MNQNIVDKLIQYVLILATDLDEWRDQRIGPIHFIKLLYLADLSYAESHNGNTYTGANWIFYHFGPWSQEINSRIPDALIAIGANHVRESSTSWESDRWHFEKDQYYESQIKSSLEQELDFFSTTTISKYLKEFGTDTYRLLHFVYRTPPMLSAAPNESLVFPKTPPEKPSTEKLTDNTSAKQKKKKAQRRQSLQIELHERLQRKLSFQESTEQPKPRYDKVFYDGFFALDDLDLDHLPDKEFTCSIDNSVWKSKARYEPDDLP